MVPNKDGKLPRGLVGRSQNGVSEKLNQNSFPIMFTIIRECWLLWCFQAVVFSVPAADIRNGGLREWLLLLWITSLPTKSLQFPFSRYDFQVRPSPISTSMNEYFWHRFDIQLVA